MASDVLRGNEIQTVFGSPALMLVYDLSDLWSV